MRELGKTAEVYHFGTLSNIPAIDWESEVCQDPNLEEVTIFVLTSTITYKVTHAHTKRGNTLFCRGRFR